MKRIGSLGLALLVFGVSAACSRTSNTRTSTSSKDGASVQVRSSSSFGGITEVREFLADVPEGATSNVLQFDARALEQGAIVLRVFAPDGTQRLEKTVDLAERREHEFALATTAGKWRLEAELKVAQGGYAVNWVAAR